MIETIWLERDVKALTIRIQELEEHIDGIDKYYNQKIVELEDSVHRWSEKFKQVRQDLESDLRIAEQKIDDIDKRFARANALYYALYVSNNEKFTVEWLLEQMRKVKDEVNG